MFLITSDHFLVLLH